MQETDSGLTPSRLLLRLREARAAAAAAASGARRARAASAAAEARAAAAEAAEARLGAALTAAQQRAHTRDELTRRLQAQFGQAQLRLVRALLLLVLISVQCSCSHTKHGGVSPKPSIEGCRPTSRMAICQTGLFPFHRRRMSSRQAA